VRDDTVRRLDEHERLVAALNASRCGTWRWDIPADIVDWDEALSRVYGIPHEQAPKTSAEFLALIHPEDRERALATIGGCIENGGEIDYEFRAVIGDCVRWIYDRSSLVRDADGRPLYMTGACLDITDRKRAEERLNAALDQQKLLLRELNHRVKNHLQMIISVLSLKASRQADEAARKDFERAISRIETIAELHGRLYRDDRVHSVDVEAYLGDICSNLERSILAEGIVLERDVQPFRFSLDQAVPIGLIVNELITNAAKYAFAPEAKGRILIRLRVRGDRVTLSIADNGRGLPAKRPSGVGTRMVAALARQIDARLRVVSKRGTAYHLAFRAAPAELEAGEA
jgi:PAS domain S-box-containing protein